MKKIFMFLVLLIPLKINASEIGHLDQTYNDELWYMMTNKDNVAMSRQYVRYSIDGNIVFCIQPGVEITTSNYIGSTDLTKAPYDLETIKKLELIGYYGYDYPNHQTLEYRMATQMLIWEEVTGKPVEFYKRIDWNAVYYDVNKEKNEILRLINNHNNKPSFDGQAYNAKFNEELEIIDLNNILNEYEIIKEDNFEYKVEENKLYIKPLVVGKIEIKFEKKKYDDLKTTIYKGQNSVSQNVALLRYSEPVISTLTINSYGKIEVNKTGEISKIDDNKELNYEFIPLENVEFTLYAYEDIKDVENNVIFQKDDLITSKITDEKGKIIFDNLNAGKYKLKETKTLQNYILDENEYIIEITENEGIKVINSESNLKKVTVSVPSTGKNQEGVSRCMSLIFLGVFAFCVKK